jgi:tetratricopeptide (TPR) repeat protein
MKFVTIICALFFTSVTIAQSESLFNEANQAYANENYEEAIAKYQEILKEGYDSKSVYYNLGNSHYKLNNVGPSVYYFEKALKLDPNDTDVKNNLAFAKQMTIDAIDEVPKSGVSKIVNSVIATLSVNGWAWLAVFASLCFVVLILLYYFSRASLKKRLFFISGSLAFVIAICAVMFAYQQESVLEQKSFGIVYPEEVTVRSEPNSRSEQLFLLHEGTKAKILEDFDSWRKIELADGKQGWVLKSNLKAL